MGEFDAFYTRISFLNVFHGRWERNDKQVAVSVIVSEKKNF